MKRIKNLFIKILKYSAIWQGALALVQFILQRSLNLHFLGERSFDISSSQIATVNFFGDEFLRSYGTFPHPNVLAAFLLITLIITQPKIKKSLFGMDNIVLFLSTIGIFFSFSKTAFMLGSLYIFLLTKNPKLKILILLLSAVLFFVFVSFLSQNYIESLAERILLSQVALDIAAFNSVFGVGSSNFIQSLAAFNIFSLGQVRLLQPVHNVFLLILSENGILGLIFFSLFTYIVIRKSYSQKQFLLSFCLLTYLSVDHFFWTLQQGQLMFFMASALLYSSKK